MTNVRLISVTPDAEKTIGYVARVSNPKNQENPNVAGLLKYCIKHQHWSIFEQAFMSLEIETTRGLAAQILRHRSFTFQGGERGEEWCRRRELHLELSPKRTPPHRRARAAPAAAPHAAAAAAAAAAALLYPTNFPPPCSPLTN